MELDHHHEPQPQQHPEASPPNAIDLVGGPFAVIESDPGVFTSLTRRLGIPGLELIELYDIEPWAVDHLNPHGLILCFLWKKDAHRPTDFADPAAERVWFAHQLSDDACATHAILNVLLNCPRVELGEELSAFRRETERMSPVMRGLAVTNSRIIRPAHNSLARPADIRSSISNLAITTLDAEKQKEKGLKAKAKQEAKEKEKDGPPPAKRAKTGATQAKGSAKANANAKGKGKGKDKEKEKASANAKPRAEAKRKRKRKSKSKYDYEDDDDEDEIPDEDEEDDDDGGGSDDEDDEDEEGKGEQAEEETYHFIGYVPAHGKVWELDGLKSGPLEVGELPSPPPPPPPLSSSSPSSTSPTSTSPSPLPSSSSHPHNTNPHPHNGWMDIARPALRLKMDKYGGSAAGGSNIRFSLLAIVDDAYCAAQDEWEFCRRDWVGLQRALSGSAIPKTKTSSAGMDMQSGWETMVDPTLLAAADAAFTPPVYPLPPSASASTSVPVPHIHPHAHDTSKDPSPLSPLSPPPLTPPSSSSPQPTTAPQTQTQTQTQTHAQNHTSTSTSTLTPSTPRPLTLKPFAHDFASRRMARDMHIMRLAESLDLDRSTQSSEVQTNAQSSDAQKKKKMETDTETETQKEKETGIKSAVPVQSPAPVQAQALAREWEKCVRDGIRAKIALEDEIVKGVRANTDDIKRTFDYDPFIRAYLAHLKDEQLLYPLLGRDEEGRKVRVGGAGRGRGRGGGRGRGKG
ncbi:Ubiquitin carboxyl-terminal hydrolase 2 [Psilocybe cubensis]|uniref:ubiquitinyl hydrolase 1 n=2 Tax=Psilocybe cubensis TaxID=181762 RepID=A0A8H7XQQ8_PSICU|nr:Ubiquitin carboxyl-terminal hydrolase 2 [Psilocybe cubensis]KAH9475453.1 Ubiquitin carboxyl-terminal hydrolase 2 [Psilocybe cubensis]